MYFVLCKLADLERRPRNSLSGAARTLLERNKMRIAQRRYNLVKDISKERN